MDKLDFIKIKKYCASKDVIKNMKKKKKNNPQTRKKYLQSI